ncbi:hypothetical protein V1264_017160 [Littorina saxatilis]|uniref:Uncharacterized protein n=1 Tax=Littorina saxatilis TaxID=31220 RepID=A0AAN9GEB4_9CAEN
MLVDSGSVAEPEVTRTDQGSGLQSKPILGPGPSDDDAKMKFKVGPSGEAGSVRAGVAGMVLVVMVTACLQLLC